MKFNVSLCLLVLTARCFAQSPLPLYYVYQVKGEAYITDGTTKKTAVVKTDMFIYAGNNIRIVGNAELKLMGYDQKLLTADRPCNLQASNLAAAFQPKRIPVSEKYIELIWKDIFQPHAQANSGSKEGLGAIWGAAERGAGICDAGLYPLGGQKINPDATTFTWNSDVGVAKYVFAIFGAGNKMIFQKTFSDTVVTIHSTDWKPAGADTDFYWDVQPINSQCPLIPANEFLLLSKAEYGQTVRDIINKVPVTSDAFLYNLEAADLLGKNGFTDEAYTYFLKSGINHKK